MNRDCCCRYRAVRAVNSLLPSPNLEPRQSGSGLYSFVEGFVFLWTTLSRTKLVNLIEVQHLFIHVNY
jgi:hypothetical protein